jgi:hypothetical protein
MVVQSTVDSRLSTELFTPGREASSFCLSALTAAPKARSSPASVE